MEEGEEKKGIKGIKGREENEGVEGGRQAGMEKEEREREGEGRDICQEWWQKPWVPGLLPGQ